MFRICFLIGNVFDFDWMMMMMMLRLWQDAENRTLLANLLKKNSGQVGFACF